MKLSEIEIITIRDRNGGTCTAITVTFKVLLFKVNFKTKVCFVPVVAL